ncbi:hypothetical protein [Janibacter melonis]|uniref:hypothetical protein n=1 Tax=Janibacter melonis TaxID=262209 RepID=UPI001748E2DB|nr:hypothetical protein [Janibacter melonis]
MIRGRRAPGKKWTRLDWLGLVALEAFEADLCPGCGQPRTYSTDDDAHRRYSVEDVTCHACAELERKQEQRKPRPGRKSFPVPDAGMRHAMAHPIHVEPFPT